MEHFLAAIDSLYVATVNEAVELVKVFCFEQINIVFVQMINVMASTSFVKNATLQWFTKAVNMVIFSVAQIMGEWT